MVLEIASISVKPGDEAAFEQAVAKAADLFRNAPGCRSLRLKRVIEEPGGYRLVVGWDRVEDHMLHFRNSPAFQGWRDLAGPHFAEPPSVVHTQEVLCAF